MAALLIALAIMAILLTVAMPVWRHEARREHEAELVFRGEQYARAVALFRFKNANIPNAFPPSIDALVQGRFLRKKYKDPMTKDGEFELIGVGSQQPGANPSQQPGSTRSPHPPGRGNTSPQPGGTGCRRHDGRAQQEHGHVDPLLPRARRDTTSGRSRSTSRRVPAGRCRWPTRPTAVVTGAVVPADATGAAVPAHPVVSADATDAVAPAGATDAAQARRAHPAAPDLAAARAALVPAGVGREFLASSLFSTLAGPHFFQRAWALPSAAARSRAAGATNPRTFDPSSAVPWAPLFTS